MENKKRSRNNNRNKSVEVQKQPVRRRRVSIDKNVEVEVMSNVPHQFFYKHPRLSVVLDMGRMGDKEFVTVGDLRTILSSSRKVLEGFQLVIVDILDDEYTLEDLLVYLGLDKKYEEFYSLSRKEFGDFIEPTDIKDFILQAPANAFKKAMATIDPKIRARVLEQAVVLFKLGEFGDHFKMKVIREYAGEDIFLDAEETELDDNVSI